LKQENIKTQKKRNIKTETELVSIFWREKKRQKIETRKYEKLTALWQKNDPGSKSQCVK